MSELVKCVDCGCDDEHACLATDDNGIAIIGSNCSWVWQNVDKKVGLCSACYSKGSLVPEIDQEWLCGCGNFVDNGLHCGMCGGEPPWGCPCSMCQDAAIDEDETAYFDWEEP